MKIFFITVLFVSQLQAKLIQFKKTDGPQEIKLSAEDVIYSSDSLEQKIEIKQCNKKAVSFFVNKYLNFHPSKSYIKNYQSVLLNKDEVFISPSSFAKLMNSSTKFINLKIQSQILCSK